MTKRFAITRADGRSNSQVIIDCVKDGEPGHIYSYDELGKALSEGTDREYGVVRVRTAVLKAVNALEKTYKRTLQNVPIVGYRLAYAKEHMQLAVVRQDRANRQLRKGLHVLQHVRWDELDDNSRRAHEGHLMLTAALYRNQIALEGRMRRAEQAIETLMQSKTD